MEAGTELVHQKRELGVNSPGRSLLAATTSSSLLLDPSGPAGDEITKKRELSVSSTCRVRLADQMPGSQVHEKRDESARASSGGAPAWRMPQLHSHEMGGNKVHKKRELCVNSPCTPRLAAAPMLRLPAAACNKHSFKKKLLA